MKTDNILGDVGSSSHGTAETAPSHYPTKYVKPFVKVKVKSVLCEILNSSKFITTLQLTTLLAVNFLMSFYLGLLDLDYHGNGSKTVNKYVA